VNFNNWDTVYKEKLINLHIYFGTDHVYYSVMYSNFYWSVTATSWSQCLLNNFCLKIYLCFNIFLPLVAKWKMQDSCGRLRGSSVPSAPADPRMFVCKLCGKKFGRHDSLTHHRRFHQGHTTCPVCQMVFSRVFTLRRHMLKVHKTLMKLLWAALFWSSVFSAPTVENVQLKTTARSRVHLWLLL
jgi:uncharacterized Zn-finger protein